MIPVKEIMLKAMASGTVIPAFNIPYLPMMSPVVHALVDTDSFGLIAVARLEWEKFEAKSLFAIKKEYDKNKSEKHTRLHLDHIPVIDEDYKRVDYLNIIKQAISAGYQSVMVDGSRLPFEQNIEATKKVVDVAHATDIPVEAELGSVFGHETGPLPSYEELFTSGKGFTDLAEAAQFVKETEVDWLSVAIGNIHGAISGAAKNTKKIEARLNIEHLQKLRNVTRIPLVLHGGSGINLECLRESFINGIAKINIGTTIRQAYERFKDSSVEKAQQSVYEETKKLIKEELRIEGTASRLV